MNTFGEIGQVAYLTDDIESAVEAWMEQSGVGPFMLYKGLQFPAFFQGEPTEVLMDVALAYQGDMQIELIQQYNDAGSPYKQFFQQGRMGLHHVGYMTNDIDSLLKLSDEKGYTTVFNGGDENMGRYAYITHPALQGVYQEFLEMTPMLESVWGDLKQKAKDWDGSKDVEVIQF